MDIWWQVLVALGIALSAAVTGWPVVAGTLRISTRQREAEPGPNPTENHSSPASAVLRGGLWLGFVERFACALAIMFGQVALVAVVVAVKGLGRFKELTTPEASERFILGRVNSRESAASTGKTPVRQQLHDEPAGEPAVVMRRAGVSAATSRWSTPWMCCRNDEGGRPTSRSAVLKSLRRVRPEMWGSLTGRKGASRSRGLRVAKDAAE